MVNFWWGLLAEKCYAFDELRGILSGGESMFGVPVTQTYRYFMCDYVTREMN